MLALLTLLLACQGSDAPAPPAAPGVADGTVEEDAPQAGLLSGQIPNAGDAYSVFVVEAASQQAWIEPVGANGSFSVPLPAGRYSLALLDEDLAPVGLFLADGLPVWELDGDKALGELSWDDASMQIVERTSGARGGVDLSDLAGVSPSKSLDGGNGISVKGELAEGDADSDGVPDFLDNDSNENGVYDSAEGQQICGMRIVQNGTGEGLSGEVYSALDEVICYAFDNLKLALPSLTGGDGDSMPYSEDHVIALHLQVPEALAPYVASVAAGALPSYADGDVSPAAGGWAFADYPEVGAAWAASGYALPYAESPDGSGVYSVWVSPDGDPTGSIYELTVTLLDGTILAYTTRLSFAFHTPPQVTLVAAGASNQSLSYPPPEDAPGSAASPLILDGTGSYLLVADRPTDSASGADICGMGVQAQIFYLDGSGHQMNNPPALTDLAVDEGLCDPSVDLQIPLSAADLPDQWEGEAIDAYKVDFTVSSPAGDNSAEQLWMAY